ncbi:hypothetical protein HYQ46_001703 [Verticillium longisporum]|nr:hypothetical protein HYQ46_001703 [Verticillium longisporum]
MDVPVDWLKRAANSAWQVVPIMPSPGWRVSCWAEQMHGATDRVAIATTDGRIQPTSVYMYQEFPSRATLFIVFMPF